MRGAKTYDLTVLDIKQLPHHPDALKRLVIEQHHTIEHLKFQLAKLRRFRFGQSSEQLEGAGQLALTLEELAIALAEAEKQNATADCRGGGERDARQAGSQAVAAGALSPRRQPDSAARMRVSGLRWTASAKCWRTQDSP
jgi:Transposase C of IS166 homeodomain